MIRFIMRGVRLRDPRLTRDWRVWVQYLCWCIQAWMSSHVPYLPMWLRIRILRRYSPKRHHLSWQMYNWWRDGLGADITDVPKPLPWPIGVAALGPFVEPWNRIGRFFRNHTGGRSHRCEFTDPESGALYGGQRGAFMDELFEVFIERISAE